MYLRSYVIARETSPSSNRAKTYPLRLTNCMNLKAERNVFDNHFIQLSFLSRYLQQY